LKLIYDRQSVGQSVLVSGAHLGHTTNFSFSWKFPSDSCRFIILWRPLWREGGSVICCTIAPGPCQSSHCWVEVPQNSWPYFTVSSEDPRTRRARFLYLYPPGTVAVAVNLRLTVSRPVCPGVRRPSGTCDQFSFLHEISFRQLRVCNFVVPSLTRGWVCKLLYNCFWALPDQSLLRWSPTELTALFYCLIWDSANLEGQVPVFQVTLVQCEISNATIGRAAWEACSATWNLGTNSAFPLLWDQGKPRKTLMSWPVTGPSECNWLLASSPALNPRTLTLVPTLCYCIFLFCFRFFFPPQQVIKFLQLFVCAYDLDKHQTI
jgi:hypothetical protein